MSSSEQKKHTWEDELQEMQDLLFADNHVEARKRAWELATNPTAPRYYQVQGMILAAYAEPEYHESLLLHKCAYTLYVGWKMRYNHRNPADEKTNRVWKRVKEQLDELLHRIETVDPCHALIYANSDAAGNPDFEMPTQAILGFSAITMVDIPPSGSPTVQVTEYKPPSEFDDPATYASISLRLQSTVMQADVEARRSLPLSTILGDDSWHDDPSIDLSLENLGISEQAEGGTESGVVDLSQRIDAALAHRPKTESGVVSPPSDDEIKPTLAQPDP